MLNVAVVGMGWWGKIIVPLLKTSKKITVGKVVEVNPDSIADFAREQGVPAYIVFGDATLRAIAAARPASIDDLDGITGIGAKKREAYGDGILTVVAAN